jgi:hypothetical protein
MLNLIKCVVLLMPQCNLPSWLVVLEKKVGEKENWERYRYKRERERERETQRKQGTRSSTQSAPRPGRPYGVDEWEHQHPFHPAPPPEENRFLCLVQTSKQSSGIFFLSHVRVIIPFPFSPQPAHASVYTKHDHLAASLVRIISTRLKMPEAG